jgi:hypothetical protein
MTVSRKTACYTDLGQRAYRSPGRNRLSSCRGSVGSSMPSFDGQRRSIFAASSKSALGRKRQKASHRLSQAPYQRRRLAPPPPRPLDVLRLPSAALWPPRRAAPHPVTEASRGSPSQPWRGSGSLCAWMLRSTSAPRACLSDCWGRARPRRGQLSGPATPPPCDPNPMISP